MLLDKKVAIVTGASRGIGRAIAEKFAAEGASVVLAARSEAPLIEVRDAILRQNGPEPLVVPTDVTSEESVQALVERSLDKYGQLDILVNNAGITRDTLLLRMTEDEWDQVLDTNLKSAFFAIKAVSRVMIRQRRGKIINISSVIGLVGNAGQANYAASKAGIIALTKSAAKELASRNILVNAIAPGFVKTDMTDQVSEAVRSTVMQAIPLKRYGAPAEIADAAVFFGSSLSDYVTGQVLAVDGGMVM